MALFIQVMRDERTFDLMDRFPRAFMLLCRIARRMGADGAPALIGPRDFAFDGVDEKGLEKRYRTAKEYLEKNGFARFESSKSGTKAWALSGVVFNLKGGRKGGVKGGQKADAKAEQFELEIDEKGGAEGGQEADAKAEQKADNRDLIQENTNTPPYIPPEGESATGVRSQESGVRITAGENAAAGTGTDGNGLNGRNGLARTAKAEIEIPEGLKASAEFLTVWGEWLQWRKSEKRKPVTAKAAKMQLEKLDEAGAWMAIRMIRQSMENDWTGLFPVKNGNTGRTGNTGAKQQPGKGGGLMSIKTRI